MLSIVCGGGGVFEPERARQLSFTAQVCQTDCRLGCQILVEARSQNGWIAQGRLPDGNAPETAGLLRVRGGMRQSAERPPPRSSARLVPGQGTPGANAAMRIS